MYAKHTLFGVTFDNLRMHQAVDRVRTWCRSGDPAQCKIAVTPNVDHVVMLQQHAALQAAYAAAALVLVDGTPIVWSSRLLRRPLVERVAGSDLVPALFEAVSREHAKVASSSESDGATNDSSNLPLRVFLLGAAPGVADQARHKIHSQWTGIKVVGTYSPPLGFERDVAENRRIVRTVNEASVDLLVIGLGAPKQELWAHQHAGELRVKVALCVGATIDFLAGHRRRSPRWMRRVGLEWLYRVLSEPRRLARRYVTDACIFPRLVWREWRSGAFADSHASLR